jgi:predicted  nucleic acid-binding Zn ribbon protein
MNASHLKRHPLTFSSEIQRKARPRHFFFYHVLGNAAVAKKKSGKCPKQNPGPKVKPQLISHQHFLLLRNTVNEFSHSQ